MGSRKAVVAVSARMDGCYFSAPEDCLQKVIPKWCHREQVEDKEGKNQERKRTRRRNVKKEMRHSQEIRHSDCKKLKRQLKTQNQNSVKHNKNVTLRSTVAQF